MSVVYTAIFGGIRDSLHPPRARDPDTIYQAYVDTDRTVVQHGWTCRPPVWSHKNARLRARRHKTLSHELYPEVEYTLWVDGCLTPLTPLSQLVDRYLQDHDICVFKHMQRRCVYQELEACIQLKKDHPHIMRQQVNRYRALGYPHHNGLAETTAVLRRHTPEIIRFNEAWWQQIKNGSVRDQLSIDFLCWQMGITYNVFAGTRTQSPHFTWRAHR